MDAELCGRALLGADHSTSEQDWDLCEHVQRGVNNSRYVPGPLSKYKEYNVEAFFQWYIQQIDEWLNRA